MVLVANKILGEQYVSSQGNFRSRVLLQGITGQVAILMGRKWISVQQSAFTSSIGPHTRYRLTPSKVRSV
jgi:hypothetical protein